MPRRAHVALRKPQPDPVYRSVLVTQLINKVMLDGKKSVAERLVYEALEIVREATGDHPTEVLTRAVVMLSPSLEVKPRRVGGSVYQVPVEVAPRRARALAMRWLVGYARRRPRERGMAAKLAAEILDARQHSGEAWRRKDEVHRAAQANKAFAHFRW